MNLITNRLVVESTSCIFRVAHYSITAISQIQIQIILFHLDI